MLRAVVRGKKRGSGLQGISPLLGNFDGAEDLLTAAVFGRLLYFSDDRIKAIFLALPGVADRWPATVGALEQVDFWPSIYNVADERIEPDVLLSFEGIDLLIEAKRYDNFAQQNSDQLLRQRKALASERDKPFMQIAIGGLTAKLIASLSANGSDDGLVCYVRWQDLFETATRLADASAAEERLMSDIRLAFRLHGIGRGRVFMGSLESPLALTVEAFPPLSIPSVAIQRNLQPLLPINLSHSHFEQLCP